MALYRCGNRDLASVELTEDSTAITLAVGANTVEAGAYYLIYADGNRTDWCEISNGVDTVSFKVGVPADSNVLIKAITNTLTFTNHGTTSTLLKKIILS